jgi:hypothetical protein
MRHAASSQALPTQYIAAAIVVLALVGMGLITIAALPAERPVMYAPLTVAEWQRGFVAETTEMTIIVRFEEPLTIKKERRNPNVVAYARIDRQPCEVILPTHIRILVSPRERRANFADPEDAETVSHEIAHCLRGAWHDPP